LFCESSENVSEFLSKETTLSAEPVNETDWSVYMEAPRYHFNLAMEHLRKKEYSKASSELTRGNSFLSFQAIRISVVVKEIEKLSKDLGTGKKQDVATMDSLTTKAMKVLSNEYAMLPLDVDTMLVFKEEYNYLFDKAKTNMRNNNRTEAAREIRRASSLIRLQAAHTGRFVKTELDLAENELIRLSSRIESSAAVGIIELDSAFQKAVRVFNTENK
jgi:hypothetical protein